MTSGIPGGGCFSCCCPGLPGELLFGLPSRLVEHCGRPHGQSECAPRPALRPRHLLPAPSGGSSPEFLGADHTATLDFRWLSGGLFPVLLSSSPCWSTTDACSASCVHPRHLLPALSGGSTPEFLGAGPSATLDFRWLYSGLFLALLLALRARTAAITLR